MGPRVPAALGWRHRLLVVAVLVAVVLPALRDRDSFPLSTYPMYAGARGTVETLPTAVGIDEQGATHRLSIATIARTDDPLIATALLRRAIQDGRAGRVCAEIARRAPEGTIAVEVVEERHDVVAGAAGRNSLLDRSVRARCAVAQ